jgi:MFS family permease
MTVAGTASKFEEDTPRNSAQIEPDVAPNLNRQSSSYSSCRSYKESPHSSSTTIAARRASKFEGYAPRNSVQIEPDVLDTPRKQSIQIEPDLDPTADAKKRAEENVRIDGGALAWSQVFVGFLLALNGFGYFNSFSLFETHWTETLGSSASDIAWVGSLSLFLLFFLGTLSGNLMDRGYFHSLIVVGCSFQILGVFATSAVTKYWQLILAQGLVQGIGNGLLFTPTIALVSTYFVRKRALAVSISACGAPFGGIIFPLMARQLTPVIGYPWTIRSMGFIIIYSSTLVLFVARPRNFKRPPRAMVDWPAFKDLTFTLFCVGIFFSLLGVYVAYFYLGTYGETEIGISASAGLILLIILNVSGIPGRIIPAFLADYYFGSFNTFLPFVLALSALFFGWIGIRNVGSYYAWTILYGACANGVQTLFPTTAASLVTDLSKMASRLGMVFSIGSFACLIGAPIAGSLISAGNGSYLYMQLFGGSTILLGFCLLGLSRWTQLARTKPVSEK